MRKIPRSTGNNLRKAMKIILGLDMGTNSIGWALIRQNDDETEGEIIATGSRLFQEAITAKERTPKNAARRAARMARRITARRSARKRALFALLVQNGMLPEDEAARHALFNDHARHPIMLRARAATEPVTLQEFGRILYHLAQRRGFKSNRKAQLGDLVKDDPDIAAVVAAEEADRLRRRLEKLIAKGMSEDEALAKLAGTAGDDEDDGPVKAGISLLRRAMETAGHETLGEHLYARMQKGEAARKLHTDRAMYEEEFERLWDEQARHHDELRNPALRAKVRHTIFFQRPLRTQRDKVSKCTLEPRRKRAHRAHAISHEFRIWQTLANIRLDTVGAFESRPLSLGEKRTIAEALSQQRTMSWASFRKLLKLPKRDVMTINLEEGGAKDLVGNTTIIDLANDLPDRWFSLSDADQQSLVTEMTNIPQKDQLIKRLRSGWGFTPEEAYRVAVRDLDEGTASLSILAMTKLLPHLKAGLDYTGAKDAVGYAPGRRPGELKDFLDLPPDYRNPVVNKVVHEVRRVINAVIRTYSRPDIIRIEMARDMKQNKKAKAKVQQQQKANERANAEAAEVYQKQKPGKRASHEDLLRYRLWQECKGVCPYTGKAIPLAELF